MSQQIVGIDFEAISTLVTYHPRALKALPMEPVPLKSSSKWGIFFSVGLNMYLGVRIDGRALQAVGAVVVDNR